MREQPEAADGSAAGGGPGRGPSAEGSRGSAEGARRREQGAEQSRRSAAEPQRGATGGDRGRPEGAAGVAPGGHRRATSRASRSPPAAPPAAGTASKGVGVAEAQGPAAASTWATTAPGRSWSSPRASSFRRTAPSCCPRRSPSSTKSPRPCRPSLSRSHVKVQGHTDSTGSAQINDALSQKRAQAVADYLESKGVASDRITAQGSASRIRSARDDDRGPRAQSSRRHHRRAGRRAAGTAATGARRSRRRSERGARDRDRRRSATARPGVARSWPALSR